MTLPENDSHQDNCTPFDAPLRQHNSTNPIPPVTGVAMPEHVSNDNDDSPLTQLKAWPKLRAFLLAMWDMPRANQLALAAVGGALAVVLVSGLVGRFMPRADMSKARNLHPGITFVDKTSPATGDNYVIEPGALKQGRGGVVQTEIMQPGGDNHDTLLSPQSNLQALKPLTEDDHKRVELRQREDQIISEKRRLEDKKRLIERQIEDKQIEEQRVIEDKKRLEDRNAQDKQVIEQRQQEEKRKLEEEQRKLDEEHRKIAEAH